MKSRIWSVSIVVTAMILAFAGALWARAFIMRATPEAPRATGAIEAKAEKAAGNTRLTIKVDHLVWPTLLTPQANQYVVWVERSGGLAIDAGVLVVEDDGKGELNTTTTESKFGVLITAENEAHPEKPSNRVVLRADVGE